MAIEPMPNGPQSSIAAQEKKRASSIPLATVFSRTVLMRLKALLEVSAGMSPIVGDYSDCVSKIHIEAA